MLRPFITAVILAALCLVALDTTIAAAATIVARDIERPDGRRAYLVVAPDGVRDTKRPVVVLLHGHGGSAAAMLGQTAFAGYRNTDWVTLADREQLVLIAPDGTPGSDGKRAWNDCRRDATTNAVTDDVGLVGALIDTALTQFDGDPQRVYVFGSSNGGGMAFRLGIELGPRLAAIGVQSATMPANSACAAPRHPPSVFMSHGTADKITPYAGGAIGHWTLRGRGTGLSVDASVALWRTLAGLPDTPVRTAFAHRDGTGDPSSATQLLWGADRTGVQVALLRIDGGGHTAPSTTAAWPWLLRTLLGEMNRDVDMVDQVWMFFRDKRASAARP